MRSGVVPLEKARDDSVYGSKAVGLGEAERQPTAGHEAEISVGRQRQRDEVEVERIANKGGPDPFFIPDPAATDIPTFDSLEVIGGLRLDLTDWTALKLEYRQTKMWDLHLTQYDGILNWSWGF